MNQNIALITGADRGLGLALCAGLLEKGWRVFAGQYMPEWPELGRLAARQPDLLHLVALDVSSVDSVSAAARSLAATTDHVDLLINNAGVISPAMYRTIREPQDYAEMHRLFDVNALGALRVVEAFLPLTDRSAMKRLCFVSSEAGSITRSHREAWFGYCMSKAALNMAVSILFNHLRPQGYTFRVYHPGWMRTYMSGQKSAEADMEPEEAAEYALAYFLRDLPAEQENRLVMRDWQGNEWPW
ncbi:MAG: SDR family NAD(P)-dependent oxidoreductase [Anaerolineae bacterium]|nr:SDR family NAD(P)-dependent oxidoreductase [Thermoflexales bacterium]MDW8406814.1 SDR family NAD(P)-dependent oxidoreductase [Anaerolineae bacterium]